MWFLAIVATLLGPHHGPDRVTAYKAYDTELQCQKAAASVYDRADLIDPKRARVVAGCELATDGRRLFHNDPGGRMFRP